MSDGTYCVACGKYKGTGRHCCACEKPIYTDSEPTKEQIQELRNRYLSAISNLPDIELDCRYLYEENKALRQELTELRNELEARR